MTGGDVEVIAGAGTVARLAELVGTWAPRRILLVGSATALERTGVPDRLAGYDVEHFPGFTPNPRLADALAGARVAGSWAPDLIVGVGGGSALDVAKLARSLPADRDRAVAVLAGRVPPVRRAPLLLVPTTAGTGSEVTGFATVYVDGVKHSLDHPDVHADLAVVDPELTYACPAEVSCSAALDALAHAVESAWALGSTCESRALATDALASLAPVLGTPGWVRSPAARAAVSAAATRAGLAIDRTRTTGGHAFAYPLTARFAVPHGLACALNLVWLLPLTARTLPRDCQDPRGAAFVARRLDEVAAILGGEPGPAVAGLIEASGFSPWLADHRVTGADLPGLVRAALGASRSTNGPVRLTPDLVLPELRARLGTGDGRAPRRAPARPRATT